MDLLVSNAIAYVRARLDELTVSPTDMLSSVVDDRNLDTTIETLLPEAITAVHLAAPITLMSGLVVDNNGSSHRPTGLSVNLEEYSSGSTEKVLVLDFTNTSLNILRLLSFKCLDSSVTINTAYSENSVFGKLQTNKYLRGTQKHPFIIETNDSVGLKPVYRYYITLATNSSTATLFNMTYFPKPEKSEDDTFFISDKLELPVINYLTALVLQTYEKADLAQLFFTRATDAMSQ